MRLIFMGTPDFSVAALHEIIAAGHEVVAVYTQPPREAGRGLDVTQSAVHRAALDLGLEVKTPALMRDKATIAEFEAFQADAAVVVAYGQILPKQILDAPQYGCFNIHASLLPRWRGAAPIQRAIMAGDTQSGVMVMKMDEGLDTGPIALCQAIDIDPNMHAGQLHDALSPLGGDLIVRALSALKQGSLELVNQPEDGVTYAKKITKQDAQINWQNSAEQIHNHIRGLTPLPGAYFTFTHREKTERVKVLQAQIVKQSGTAGTLLSDDLIIGCGDDALQLIRLQRAGKQAMHAAQWARGVPDLHVGFQLDMIRS